MIRVLVLCVLALALPRASVAAAIYSYTGSTFTGFDWASGSSYENNFFTSLDRVTVTVSLSQAVVGPAGTTLNYDSFSPGVIIDHQYPVSDTILLESWAITAGPLTYTNADLANRDSFSLEWTFDGSGAIVYWSVQFTQFDPSRPGGTIFQGSDSYIRSYDLPGSPISQDFAASCRGDVTCLNGFGYPAGHTESPGIWTVPVPEPSLGALLGVALAALFNGASSWRKQR